MKMKRPSIVATQIQLMMMMIIRTTMDEDNASDNIKFSVDLQVIIIIRIGHSPAIGDK